MKKIIKLTESDLTNIVKRVIKESNTKNYSKSILGVLEGFENDYVCGFDVDYQEDTEIYLIKTIIGNRDLDKDILTNVGQRNYLNRLKKDITEYLISYLPIKFLVDFKRTANCSDYKKYKQIAESDETNIIKKVTKENAAKDPVIDMLKNDGLRSTTELVGSFKNIKKIIGDKLSKSETLDLIKTIGAELTISILGGEDNFRKSLGVNTPEEFLSLFNDLKPELYKSNPNYYFLVDNNGLRVVAIRIYESGFTRVSVVGKIFWYGLGYGFNIRENEIMKLLEKWLRYNYGIDANEVVTTGGLNAN